MPTAASWLLLLCDTYWLTAGGSQLLATNAPSLQQAEGRRNEAQGAAMKRSSSSRRAETAAVRTRCCSSRGRQRNRHRHNYHNSQNCACNYCCLHRQLMLLPTMLLLLLLQLKLKAQVKMLIKTFDCKSRIAECSQCCLKTCDAYEQNTSNKCSDKQTDVMKKCNDIERVSLLRVSLLIITCCLAPGRHNVTLWPQHIRYLQT